MQLLCFSVSDNWYSAYKEEQKGKKEAAASDKKRKLAEAMAQEPAPMDQVHSFL